MALAHGVTARLSASALWAEGSAFARQAWRECWLPMLPVVIGHTFMFLDQHVPPAEWRPGLLGGIAPLLMLFYLPLYGALYRAALGGQPRTTRGFGGLQWSAVEWRLIAVGVVVAFLAGLAMTPFLAANGVVALILRGGVISAGPLGQWARWTPVAIVIWAVFFWFMAPRLARLALGWPFSVAREKTEPFAGFAPSRGSGWALVIALAACLIPLLLGWAAVYAIGLIETDAVSGVYWPLPEAVGMGALLGAIKAMIVAPLTVGVLCGAWWLLEGDHRDAGDDQGLAAAAAAAALATDHSTGPVDGEGAAGEHGGGVHPAPEVDVEPPKEGDPKPDGEPLLNGEGEPGPEVPNAGDGVSGAETPAGAEIPGGLSPGDDRAGEAAAEPPLYLDPPSRGPEALSPWPHSILPPWPTSARGFELPPHRPASTFGHGRARVAADPLASSPEPAHASDEATESG